MTLSPLSLEEIDALLCLLDSYPSNLPPTLQSAGSKLLSLLRAFTLQSNPPELPSVENQFAGLRSFQQENEQADELGVRSSVTRGIERVSSDRLFSLYPDNSLLRALRTVFRTITVDYSLPLYRPPSRRVAHFHTTLLSMPLQGVLTLCRLPLLLRLLGEHLVTSTFLLTQLYLDTIPLPTWTQLLQLPDLPFASLLVGLDLLPPVKGRE